MKNIINLYYRYLHLNILISYHISEESYWCQFYDCRSWCYLEIYTTHFTTCDTTTVIAQFCIVHTATKQKLQGDLTVHTCSRDNSSTFLNDSKLKIKKQGSFFITLIDILKDIWLQSVIKHKTCPKTTNSTAVRSTNPEHQKMKEKVGNFISPKQIFIIMELSDCAANKSFIFKPFWINS